MLYLVLGLLCGAVYSEGLFGSAETCVEQNGCVTFSIEKVSGADYPSSEPEPPAGQNECVGDGCYYKLCVQISTSKSGCTVDTYDAISHICDGCYDDPSNDARDNNEYCGCNSGNVDMGTGSILTTEGVQEHDICYFVAAGTTVDFVIKDGNSDNMCAADGQTDYTSQVDWVGGESLGSTVSCQSTDTLQGLPTCAGQGTVGKSCLWRVAVPSTCSGEPNLPGDGGAPGASGDPHFVGFSGEDYDFFGVPGAYFNLMTASNLQVNAHFSEMLNVFDGNMRTLMDEIIVMSSGHRMVLSANGTLTVDGALVKPSHDVSVLNENFRFAWNTEVVNVNENLSPELDQRWYGRVPHVSSYRVVADIGDVHMEAFIVSTSRMPGLSFIDLTVAPLASNEYHGIVGQTAQGTAAERQLSFPVEGREYDYMVLDGPFGTQFRFNRFSA